MAVPTPVGDVKNSVPNYDFRAKYIDTPKKCIFFFYLFIYLIILICLFTFCFLIVRSDLVLSLFFYRLCTGIWPPETF